MQKSRVREATCRDEQGALHTFRYRLIAQLIETDRFALESYGVRVEEAGGESAQVCGVTCSAAHAERLLSLLARHAVTPLNLPEVLADLAQEAGPLTSARPAFSSEPRSARSGSAPERCPPSPDPASPARA